MLKFGGADRLMISKESHKIYKILCDKEEIFPHYKDLFHFAAAIGIRLKKRKSARQYDQPGRAGTFRKPAESSPA